MENSTPIVYKEIANLVKELTHAQIYGRYAKMEHSFLNLLKFDKFIRPRTPLAYSLSYSL